MKKPSNLNKQDKKRFACEFLFFFTVTAVIFELMYLLFSFQAEAPMIWKKTTPFLTDLPYHIDFAITSKRVYSLMMLILKMGYSLGKNKACALILATMVVLTLYAACAFLKKCIELNGGENKPCLTFLLSCAVCFMSGIYIPYLFPVFYANPDIEGSVSTGVTQPWHNSTYIAMRLFAFVTVMLYIKLEAKYLEEGITFKEWLLFCVFLTLTNFSKPNFFIAFAPAMLLMLVYDLISTKGKGLKNIIIFGSAVLCSMPVFYFQSGVLYPDSAEEEYGITFSAQTFVEALSNKYFYISILSGFLFVIAVTLVCIIKKCVNRNLVFGWLMMFFAEVARWFIFETGPRAHDGNFTWGVYIASAVLTVFCLERLLKLRGKVPKIVIILLSAVFGTMVICGAVYFANLMGSKFFLM